MSAVELPDFPSRHIGPTDDDVSSMLGLLGYSTMEDLLARAVPAGIRAAEALAGEAAPSEPAVVEELRVKADRNQVLTSMIGLGYYGTHTPAVVRRNILENP